jgi:NAD(P)-dependent dehydrogenase (short-subunit alcohol dehydrogenase family)
MGLLDGKVAIITGAGGGLGRAYALLLAHEGAAIVVNDFGGARDGTAPASTPAAQRVVDEIQASGGRAVANTADVSTADGGRSILESALQAFGRADILINNAGIVRDKTLVKLEESDWDAVINVHLRGTYCVTRPVFTWMKERGDGGVIVNTASTQGLFGGFGQTNYGAAKAGVFGFSNSLALEGKKAGIRVWTICPMASTRLSMDVLPEDLRQSAVPDRVAPVVLYMVSDLSGQQTGKVIYAGGNRVQEFRIVSSAGFVHGGQADARTIAANADKIFLGPTPPIEFL